MSQDRWSAVDHYIGELFTPHDASLDAAIRSSAAAGLPAIHVSAPQGKQLMLLARMIGARRILEIGTLGGYSTIWLARGLAPGGHLITLESVPKHADVARENITRAGFQDVVEIRLGRAIDTLPRLVQENRGPFDLIFIDADKTGYPDYLEWSLRLARIGSVIVADNVVRNGAVIEPDSSDANVQAVRIFNARLAAEKRVDATVLQTVGSKGYDGYAIAVVIR